MSVDLSIDTDHDLLVDALPAPATAAAIEITDSRALVTVEMLLVGHGSVELPLPREARLFDRRVFGARPSGFGAGRAMFWAVPAMPGDAAYVHLEVGSRDPLAYVITAAVAMAIARLTRAKIGDGGNWVARSGYYTADEFRDAFLGNPAMLQTLAQARLQITAHASGGR